MQLPGLVALQPMGSSGITDQTPVSPALAGGFLSPEPPGNTGIETRSPSLWVDSLPAEPQGRDLGEVNNLLTRLEPSS